MMRTADDAGHTLVEIMAATTVMIIGVVGAMGALRSGTSLSETGQQIAIARGNIRDGYGQIADLLTETSIAFVDTSMRYRYALAGYSFESDRFAIPLPGVRQCPDPVCGWHTNRDLSQREEALRCAYERRSYSGPTPPVVRGKVWPAALTHCPLDGATLIASSTTMDGMKFFTARSPNGSFATSAGSSPEPHWGGLVLVFPYADSGLPELRRYEFHTSDFAANGALPQFSMNWTAFDPHSPTMVDLFDFGTDGTLNGQRDRSVPTTVAASDADYELFTVSTHGNVPAIIYQKSLNAPGVWPYRRIDLVVKMGSGEIIASITHQDDATTFWTANVTFVRPPTTLVTNVTEFAVSTAASNPFDETSNPMGIESAATVRLSLVTTTEARRQGAREWHHHLETLDLTPRNR